MTELKPVMLLEPRLTLAVAESLTCGRLQARIGAISGASEFFLGGITAYTLEQKARHLGVDRNQAQAVNSVSAEVAEQMARGACELFGSDIGAATTGYAEASPERGVAAPFAWWALARRNSTGGFDVMSRRTDLPGLPRTEVQEKVAFLVLDALASWVRAKAAGCTP